MGLTTVDLRPGTGHHVAAPVRSLTEETSGRPPWSVVFGGLLMGMVACLLGVQGAVLVELAKPEVWAATGSIEIRDGRVQPESATVVLASPSIWRPITRREGISDKEFERRYSVAVAGGTQILDVTFEDEDPERATRIVDDIIAAYIAQFSAPPPVQQTELLEGHLAALKELEGSIMASLATSDFLPRLQQIDLRNELIQVRQQITTVIFRLDNQDLELQERRDVDPRVAAAAFVLEEPVTPDPLKAAVFGFLAGGLVGVAAIYLAFHRDTVRTARAEPAVSSPLLHVGGAAPHRPRFALAVKRSIDVIVSALVLLVTAPVMLVVALAVKLTSRGPILFRQDRIGRLDRPFTLYKFRTMRAENDDSEHRAFVTNELEAEIGTDDGAFKLKDSRVTPVGRILRRFSIDELPQLWNVLRGDMSLVGPRPAMPWETVMFEARYRDRTLATPGCTGLWQVSGRNTVSIRRMLEFDVEYVRTWSLRRDLAILIRTPLVVLRGDGAR